MYVCMYNILIKDNIKIIADKEEVEERERRLTTDENSNRLLSIVRELTFDEVQFMCIPTYIPFIPYSYVHMCVLFKFYCRGPTLDGSQNIYIYKSSDSKRIKLNAYYYSFVS